MKAVEFQSQLNSDQTLTVPPSVMGAIPIGQTVRCARPNDSASDRTLSRPREAARLLVLAVQGSESRTITEGGEPCERRGNSPPRGGFRGGRPACWPWTPPAQARDSGGTGP